MRNDNKKHELNRYDEIFQDTDENYFASSIL